MGRRGKGSNLNLDLMLNLSPPSQAYYDGEATLAVAGSMSSSEISAIAAVGSLCISSPESHTSSCSSSTTQHGTENNKAGMVLVGCQRCLMYFMLSELDLKCPKCKSNSLLCFNNRNR
uniref:Runt domain-containing protein n=1 Tax=Kalanchoe fedtschenkoi TaxID=63787 RepID=A0A7N0UXV4_KALFE